MFTMKLGDKHFTVAANRDALAQYYKATDDQLSPMDALIHLGYVVSLGPVAVFKVRINPL
jgi:hypothetical protein